LRILRRRRVIKAVNIRQQDQQIGRRHGGHARGKAVIIAISDFAGRHGVVFIDDGRRAEKQQPFQRLAGVEIAAALLGVAQRHQHLSRDDLALGQSLGPDARERDLAHGGGSLAIFKF
jgi:hypothetical protein